MKTNEERIEAMHRRAAKIEKENRMKQILVVHLTATVACIIGVILTAYRMSGFQENIVYENSQNIMNGSIFTENVVLGFIVTGIIAFLLGISLTIFCYRFKQWKDDKEQDK